MRRDRSVWVAYLTLALSAFVMSSLSASLPLLSSDLRLDLAQAGNHATAVALGIFTAGLLGDRLLRRFGAAGTLRLASVGVGLGTLGLVLARAPGASLPACWWMAGFGSMNGIVVLSGLSAHPRRARALAEATMLASLAAACAPVALAQGPGWRLAMLVGVVGLAVAVRALPAVEPPLAGSRGGPLPGRFWGCWTALVCGIAVEQSTVLWGALFMQDKLHLRRADAVSLISLFLLSMLLGRLVGSRLAQHRDERSILRASVGLSAVGFLLYWLGGGLATTLLGLVITGLGVANFYPMTVALAMRTAPDAAGRVSARASLAAGTAFLVGPSLLAALGDRLGLARAQAQIPVLLLLFLVSLEWGARQTGVFGLSVAECGHGEMHSRLGPG